MEQRLDATYLRHGIVERVIAVGIGAVCVGIGILLAAWGISFLWRYTPPEIRIANPELHVTQDSPLKVTQDKPFVIETPHSVLSGVSSDAKTTAGDVIKHEVTVFSKVTHGPGEVVTGWRYKDGSGGVPKQQYCYYSAANLDHSSQRVDIAANGVQLFEVDAELVPDLEVALAKCQWWQG
jgi:hypothetical protein